MRIGKNWVNLFYNNRHNKYEKDKVNVIKGYDQIHSINELKKALYKNGPAYIAFPVYNYSNRMWKPENDEQKQNGGPLE